MPQLLGVAAFAFADNDRLIVRRGDGDADKAFVAPFNRYALPA